MSTVPVYNTNTKSLSETNLEFQGLPEKSHHDLIVRVIVQTRNNARIGTACAKTRGEVNFSTRKPWRQKGTGNARAGTRRSPIWVRGGVTFPPRPRSYATTIPKKQRRLAFNSAIKWILEEKKVYLVSHLKDEMGKTNPIIKKLNHEEFAKGRNLIIFDPTANGKLLLSLRNTPSYIPIEWKDVCTYDLINCRRVLITEEAVQGLEKRIEYAKK
ncbi:MAG: 50S ribosomal protein L4 [Caldisericia bacterium]|nr:50S ribosomal protein L4 [Caldisericia bacterium]